MDKETPEIAPTNLDGTVVNTVHTPTSNEAERAAAAAAEKEKEQDYYVDPLEQEAKMKEKLEKIEARKELDKKDGLIPDDEQEKTETAVDETIRPDMNVSGFFSTGETAKKQSFISRPASSKSLAACAVFGVISAIYSAFYTVSLISTNFDTSWFFGWIYAVVVIASVVIVITGIRSLKTQNDSLKRKALIGIVGSAISAIPLIALLIHLIISNI